MKKVKPGPIRRVILNGSHIHHHSPGDPDTFEGGHKLKTVRKSENSLVSGKFYVQLLPAQSAHSACKQGHTLKLPDLAIHKTISVHKSFSRGVSRENGSSAF